MTAADVRVDEWGILNRKRVAASYGSKYTIGGPKPKIIVMNGQEKSLLLGTGNQVTRLDKRTLWSGLSTPRMPTVLFLVRRWQVFPDKRCVTDGLLSFFYRRQAEPEGDLHEPVGRNMIHGNTEH